MDVAWLLNRRLDFIRQLYACSSAPFVDSRTKIENGEEPFVPPYSGPGARIPDRMAGGPRFDRRPRPRVPLYALVGVAGLPGTPVTSCTAGT